MGHPLHCHQRFAAQRFVVPRGTPFDANNHALLIHLLYLLFEKEFVHVQHEFEVYRTVCLCRNAFKDLERPVRNTDQTITDESGAKRMA
jgi:hypothetical protein